MDKPKVETSKTIKKDVDEVVGEVKFDDVTTTQQAINMAVAERRVVRYLTNKTREEILGQIDDKKGCMLRKPDKDSREVAIVPPHIKDFSFDTVDTSLILQRPKSNLIWTP